LRGVADYSLSSSFAHQHKTMGKKKSTRGAYKPFSGQIYTDSQPQGYPTAKAPKALNRYLGRRVFILELDKGGIEYLLRNKYLPSFGKINRLKYDGGNSVVVHFATQSSATSCVRMLDVFEQGNPQTHHRLSALYVPISLCLISAKLEWC